MELEQKRGLKIQKEQVKSNEASAMQESSRGHAWVMCSEPPSPPLLPLPPCVWKTGANLLCFFLEEPSTLFSETGSLAGTWRLMIRLG